MADERIEILGRVPLFDGLPAGELAAVANAAKERRYDTGDVIVGEGEGGIGFFVIAEGTARVEAHGERRGTLGPGASFGEVALLDEGGGRRTASVIAESPVRAFGLTSWQFTPLLEQHPQIAVKVAKILARRLREAEERATPAS
ncbi:MAG TPA: cyclic nucleotide-binding domain-containing protein [Gaiellales bacterium]|jgi:CRP/FNR family cyclic AMP-dependent transcriptional regulator|nr:cyclic nucleotide-binding domain-containing protein [Gaiellales bacterium]HSS54885.1 cyclic nucleotide-binding domain-containing protein [Gaiellales bacterium]HWG81819.1 cyclic nucleotide-binding domain-containing protein [Gaiellales bacterium]HWH65872.1 cyclic nucleotide-binding domain-containing protein [Gaiellales bacterium]HZI35865.1 cyclic nucleotide-binding domain-containing protein [Gaiellales bacterium]